MKFIHAADIHLDSPLRGLERYEGVPADEVRGATRRAFDHLVELAIDEAVDFVLLAGDLYDGDWKDYNTGLYFIDRMHRLRDAGIAAFVIAGNHDAASQITRHLKLPDNVTLFSNKKPQRVVLDELPVAIHGQGFAQRQVTEDLSRAYPQGDPHLFNIGLLHTCLDGKPGHEPYAPCSVDGLRSKGYQYWALGHVHTREVVSSEPWIVFPGNIQGRHIRETGAKGCSLVTVEQGEVAGVEHRDTDVLRWTRCRVDVSRCQALDDVYDQVRDALRHELDLADGRPVAARLVLEGEGAMHERLHAELEHCIQECRALANGLGGAGAWLEKVRLETRPRQSLAQAMERDDALSGLLRGIDNLDTEQVALQELNDELVALRDKLPPDALTGEDGFDPTAPDVKRDALEDVKALLLDRLLGAEGKG